jgi:hypothetical protein
LIAGIQSAQLGESSGGESPGFRKRGLPSITPSGVRVLSLVESQLRRN